MSLLLLLPAILACKKVDKSDTTDPSDEDAVEVAAGDSTLVYDFGGSIDILDADFAGAYMVRRTIMDQNYLYEFRHKSRLNAAVYRLWSITSDCGRSFGRWAFWTAIIAVLFAVAYGFVDIDYGDYETKLSPLYYSVVTMTTLGYGDALPASVGGQVVAMIQVVIGYVMLGGVLSIFATKMGRRAE